MFVRAYFAVTAPICRQVLHSALARWQRMCCCSHSLGASKQPRKQSWGATSPKPTRNGAIIVRPSSKLPRRRAPPWPGKHERAAWLVVGKEKTPSIAAAEFYRGEGERPPLATAADCSYLRKQTLPHCKGTTSREKEPPRHSGRPAPFDWTDKRAEPETSLCRCSLFRPNDVVGR